jgi:hypothetical protein
MPPGKDIYAMRDIERLKSRAASYGPSVGAYAEALLDCPLPWTSMRRVYMLIGLVGKWGAERVDQACRTALEAEAVDVKLVARMLERALEGKEPPGAAEAVVVQARFARDPSEFAVAKAARP